MSPEEVSIRDGDRVTMNFTSDSPIEIHVHGHDLEREVEPGERSELSFEATVAAPAFRFLLQPAMPLGGQRVAPCAPGPPFPRSRRESPHLQPGHRGAHRDL